MLDLFLVLAGVSFGISGYRQGFVIGVAAFAGFLGGGFLGMAVAPKALEEWETGSGQALVAVLIVLGLATVGQILAQSAGSAIRRRVTWDPVRALDAGGGAVLSVVSMLLVAWFVGTAVAQSSVPQISHQVRGSQILTSVDRVMPDPARSLFSSFRRILDQGGFPQVFSGISPAPIVPVEAPDPSVSNRPGVRHARPSIVKVIGTAAACSRSLEGTGFVYARERIMTNAHVVAGVSDPEIELESGRTLDARVVVFDENRDLAVLYVPGLGRRTLDFTGPAERGDDAVVAGYPRNGPFRVDPARIRDRQDARGPDIYQEGLVTREVYAVHARVEPGNSGGPLLAPNGDVYGVVFAVSVDDPGTGYALTADEVSGRAQQGRRATAQVGTGTCT
ncbi:MAG: MarP family serine protease [Actinomycetes bacterium]